MNSRRFVGVGLAAGFGVSCVALSGCGRATASERSPRAADHVRLTVYKDDFGLVAERRAIELKTGTNQVRLEGISHDIDPDSVNFETPGGVSVDATTYDLGPGNGRSLVQSLGGQRVELIWNSTDGHPGERIEGVLEPTGEDGFLLRSGDKVYVNPSGTLVVPASAELSTLPGLAIQLRSDRSGSQDLGVSYLTRGLSWSADYVANLDRDEGRIDLQCWASVTNKTGIPYPDAKISFVAGSPNRAVRTPATGGIGGAAPLAEAKAKTVDKEEMAYAPVGDLYEYKAAGPASIRSGQINRVRMFEAKNVPVTLDYSVRLPEIYAYGSSSSFPRQNAQLGVHFANRSNSGLGMPMPSGGIRIFERDGQDSRFTGADTISDTPVNSPIFLTMSKVFDVTAEPSVLSVKRVDKRTMRRSLRVILRNAKAREVEVRVVQGVYGPWSNASGEKAQKIEAGLAQWRVRIPAHGEYRLESTLDTRY